MAFRIKRTVDTTTSLPTGIPSYSKISQMVKKLINASQYDYHQSEAFEVKEVNLNSAYKGYGAVTGTFINNPNQVILGGSVLPLMPNISQIPVIGEHVVVTEYNGQHYYTSIINRKNSPNENSQPGASGIYEKDTKYGETFQRNTKISRVNVNEGDVVYEGRFGNSIKLGSNPKNQSPNIRIRAGQDKQYDTINIPAKENINKDGSSIYLSTNETISIFNPNFPNAKVDGNSIAISSDKLFLNGRDGNINIRASKKLLLEADEVFINAKKAGTIKMGDPRAPMIPTVNGQKLFELISSLTKVLLGLPKLPTGDPTAAADVAKGTKDIVSQVKNKEFLNTQVVTADPKFKIPEIPPIPPLPDPEAEAAKLAQGVKIPKKPSLDNLQKRAEELL